MQVKSLKGWKFDLSFVEKRWEAKFKIDHINLAGDECLELPQISK